jgi:2-pyrone-4,6-dicarboxylate lactonase
VTKSDATAKSVYVPSPGCPPPHPSPRRPSIKLPADSCDSHCHVFGPGAVFPYSPDRPFTPHDVPKEAVRDLHRLLGITRAVIVQSSCNGFDHTVLLDALAQDPARLRGIGLIGPQTTPVEIKRLHEAGVRGYRLNFVPHLRQRASSREIEECQRLVAEWNWHVEIHTQGTGVLDCEDLIRSFRSRVVIDHLGRVDLSEGLDGPSVHALLNLLDAGNVWVKVSGVDRLSAQGPPYSDSVALARLLVEHRPDRVLWGTDFPHPNITGDAPDDGLLVDLLAQIAPTGELMQLLLVSNPAEFFDF